MGTTTTTFALNKPTVGGDDNAWGTDWNTNADKLDDLLDGTTAIKPNLSEGLWKVGGVAVTATAAELNILDGVTASTAELNILDGATLTVTELNYVDGVTSAIQTQLDAKYDSGDIASQAEAEAGTDNTKLMTPLRAAQASLGKETTLGTISTASGSSFTLSGLDLTGYRFLRFKILGAQSATTNAELLLNTVNLGRLNDGSAAIPRRGFGYIDLSDGVFSVSSSAGNFSLGTGGLSGVTTASTSITFTISAGAANGGSIVIYGVK